MKDEEEKVKLAREPREISRLRYQSLPGIDAENDSGEESLFVPRLMHRRHYAVSDFVVRRFLIVSAPKPTRNTAISPR